MTYVARFLKRVLMSILSLFPARLSGISVLMYHSVSDSKAFFAVPPKRFEKQMRYIRENGVDTVFSSEIPSRLQNGQLANTICVTFDDGYEDVYKNAYPILKSLAMKATGFLITSEIGGSYTNSEGRSFPLLKRNQIEEMLESGLIEFAPHGHTHRKLHGLDAQEQEKEIISSRDEVKSLTGFDPRVFAYPRGRTTSGTKLSGRPPPNLRYRLARPPNVR